MKLTNWNRLASHQVKGAEAQVQNLPAALPLWLPPAGAACLLPCAPLHPGFAAPGPGPLWQLELGAQL